MAALFIYPDLEFNIQLVRVLSVLDKTSLNRSGNAVMTIEKIAVFDFLVQHPYIFFKLLMATGKKTLLSPNEIEIHSINNDYPNTQGLFVFDDLKKFLQALIIYGQIEVTLSDNEPLYLINERGKEFLKNIDTPYIYRINELTSALAAFQSETYKNLLTLIKPFINGK